MNAATLAQSKIRPTGKFAATLFMVCFFCVFFGLIRGGTAHAETDVPIDNTAPTPNSGTTSGGADFTPVTGVGDGNFNGEYMWYKIYVPIGDSTNITVNQQCDDVGSPTVSYFIKALSDEETDGSGRFLNLWKSNIKTSGPGGCNNNITFSIPANGAGTPSGILGHTNYRVFAFTAQISPTPGSNERYFRVAADDTNAYVGLASPEFAVGHDENKLYKWSTIYKPSGTWSASVMFAPQCFDNTSSPVTIQVFDADNGIYQNNMHASIDRSNGYPLSWNKNWMTYTAQQVQGGPWGQSNTVGSIQFPYTQGDIYKLHILDSSYPNTIQVRLPFDQFDAKATVQASCNVSCQVTSPKPSEGPIPEDQDTNVYIRGYPASQNWVADGGNGFYIKRIGSNDSEANYVSLSGSQPYKDVVHPPPGTTSVTYTYGIYYANLPSPSYTGISCPVKYTVQPNLSYLQASCDYTDVVIPTSDPNYGGQYGIQWQDDNGNNVGPLHTYTLAATASGETPHQFDTFNDFPELWPHNTYTAELFVKTTSGWPASPQRTDSLDQCLDGACGSPPSAEGEIGQTQTINYVFNLNNQTLKQFSSGYSATITTSGGISIVGASTVPLTVKTGDNDVTVTFTIMNNYDGNFIVTLNFNNTPITSLSDWGGQCSAPTTAVTMPYFQVWNGDISTGGGFGDKTGNPDANTIGACGDTYPYVDTTNSQYSGGIVGFGEETNYLGSQSDFGALAMGLIPGSNGGPVGFFSGSPYPLTPDSSPKPIFANTGAVRNASNRGGYLSGTAPNFDCTKDYFDDTQSNPNQNSNSLQTDINTCGVGNKCQDYYIPGDMTINGAALPVNSSGVSNQVTLYVDGNVTITGNITYPKIFDASDPAHMPYLTIIAKGNITLGPGVTELDGLYIAQPTSNSSGDGIFATCDNSNSVCNQQLVVNGAVIAQQIELLRMHGTLHQPAGGDVNGVGSNPAEIFNFVPSMVIGSPAFPATSGQSQGIYTLPPVF